jgi:transcriptional regulator with XRE-family HTH domain
MKELHLDAKEAVSTNLKSVRKRKGWTQAQLAERSGLKQSTVSQIESGAWPDYKSLVAICSALEVEHTEITSHPELLEYFRKQELLKREIK